MLFRRFLIAALVVALPALTLRFFPGLVSDTSDQALFYSQVLPYLLFSASLTLLIPGGMLLVLERVLKKPLPEKLTRLSFLFHACGLLIIFTVLCLPHGEQFSTVETTLKVMVYIGLFLAILGMSLLPAILLIALRKNKQQ